MKRKSDHTLIPSLISVSSTDRSFFQVHLRFLFLLSFLFVSQASGDELKVVPPPESPQQVSPSDTILAKDIQKHITFLASDTLEGREAGTQGGSAAGAYIAAFLKKLDQLKPAGNNDCFQYFDQNYRNILFEIPGTDQELTDEIILIGGQLW